MITRNRFVTLWVCGKLPVDECGNVEILWVSFIGVGKKSINSSKVSHNRMFWNVVVTPAVCGKKVLAIGPDTFFIISGIVQRTYAVCYGFLIAVIHAKCNAAETVWLFPIRRSSMLIQSDLQPGISIRVWSALLVGEIHHRSTIKPFQS